MIIHKFPNEDITIYPIADVHLGSQECMEQEFIKFINMVKETPNVYLALGGDLIDNGTRNGLTNVFRATMPPSQQKREMANILAPVRDKILCAVSGNHERRSGKDVDDDPTYDILCKLDKEEIYRENMAFVKLQFGNTKNNGAFNPTYTLVVTHGAGGGQLTSGAVLRGERFGYAVDGMDALIIGHTHKPFITNPGKIVIDKFNNIVSVKPFKVINMTSWLKYGDYAAQKMLLPSTHSLQTLTLRGNRKEMVVSM
jgi:UDP-2,3-diacylglucosamine pyrophosphatase LpxH